MRKPRKFTQTVNMVAIVLLVAAVVALFCTHRIPNKADAREPASTEPPVPQP